MGKPKPRVAYFSHIYAKDNGYVVDVYAESGSFMYQLPARGGRKTHKNWWKAVAAAKAEGLRRLPDHLGGR